MDKVKRYVGIKQPVRRAVYSQDLTPHDRWGIIRKVGFHGGFQNKLGTPVQLLKRYKFGFRDRH